MKHTNFIEKNPLTQNESHLATQTVVDYQWLILTILLLILGIRYHHTPRHHLRHGVFSCRSLPRKKNKSEITVNDKMTWPSSEHFLHAVITVPTKGYSIR